MAGTDDDADVLSGSIEEARRILALEIEVIEQQYVLTERVLRLGVAVLAGAIAVSGLLLRVPLSGAAVGAVAVSLGVNVVGVARAAFVLEANGPGGATALGVDIGFLAANLADPSWKRADLDRSLMESYGVTSAHNRASILAIGRGRRLALRLLALGTVMYLRTLAFILG